MDHKERGAPPHLENSVRMTPLVLVTVCTAERKPILTCADIHDLLQDVWRNATAWLVGDYILMPDHLHLFCVQGDEGITLQQWSTYWKSLASRRWPRRHEHPIWQRHFWDRQLRSDESYEERWYYVRQNAVRHGLVITPEQWEFQGRIFNIDHETVSTVHKDGHDGACPSE